jgi:8-oxo-dGTP diphosphatase
MPRERAGVLLLDDKRLAVIERQRGDRHYWVIPGGGVEDGEDPAAAAEREAAEELGVPVDVGRLLVQIDHRTRSGIIERQWYFEATADDRRIQVVGPETGHGPDHGSYSAVWLPLDRLDPTATFPKAVATWVLETQGHWPPEVHVIDER